LGECGRCEAGAWFTSGTRQDQFDKTNRPVKEPSGSVPNISHFRAALSHEYAGRQHKDSIYR